MRPGILTIEQARPIAQALESIDREVDVSALTYTGEVEDFFFLIEKELRKRLGPDLAGRLHTARSRNDIDHTLFKLGLKQRIDPLLERMVRLAETLTSVAERESNTLIVAYTHGQPAQPTVFGHYLSAVLETLLRDIARLEAARDIVDRCPMGAAAITTSGFPIDRDLMAHLLGFSRPLQNSYSCIASIDYITSTYSAIELAFLHLGRFIQDLQFWTSFEVGQIYVPNAFVQISSIMPQKRNPVPIEHMRHLASQTVGPGAGDAHDHAQHALHRHERQRGREPGLRLRRLRERRAGSRPARGPRSGLADQSGACRDKISAAAASP